MRDAFQLDWKFTPGVTLNPVEETEGILQMLAYLCPVAEVPLVLYRTQNNQLSEKSIGNVTIKESAADAVEGFLLVLGWYDLGVLLSETVCHYLPPARRYLDFCAKAWLHNKKAMAIHGLRMKLSDKICWTKALRICLQWNSPGINAVCSLCKWGAYFFSSLKNRIKEVINAYTKQKFWTTLMRTLRRNYC